jgi:hypothetical protein
MKFFAAISRRATALLMAGLLASVHAFAAEADGPYVVNVGGKLEAWSVEVTPDGLRKRVTPLSKRLEIAVPAVGKLPTFTVKLRPPAAMDPDTVEVRADAPLFVVADTHGEYEILASMLKAQHVVDGKLRWNFGRGHLVVLGDVFDRGAHQTEILWLIYELEAEARKAGGGVHFVLGNHEAMELQGDLRYLNPRYRETTQLLGVDSYDQLFNATSVLGQWLRSKAAVLKLNDLLCLHGGISPELVGRGWTLAQINDGVRSALGPALFANAAERERVEFLFGESGPLWYRGYFPDESGAVAVNETSIAAIRNHFGVARILVGHTKVSTITPLFDGQVIAVQVYPHLDSFGNAIFEALLIRDGIFLRARTDGGSEALFPQAPAVNR